MQNQPYPGRPTPAQPDPADPAAWRSFFARHRLLTVFLASLALVVVMAVASNLVGRATPAGAAGAVGAVGAGGAADPDEGAPGLGAAVRDGKLEFTVMAVEPGVTHVGDELLGADPQGQFVLLHVVVTNVGDAARRVDAGAQRLVDTQGREHSADPTAGGHLGDAESFLDDVGPGSSIEGVVVFDVPADVVPASVELHDSFMSGGTTVALD
ncbi:DUF4352 domain-containing protein [Oerskovia sp. NPDC057915]|uniref:DUF4352 domain-containing protein n=1 Tax=Oerskovia sp. NPDC057915 TaxID=3346280 RepID=UPI0036DE2D2A